MSDEATAAAVSAVIALLLLLAVALGWGK